MKLTVTTESGSVYVLDKTKMTWERRRLREYDDEEKATISHPMRTSGGKLMTWPVIEVGMGLDLICPPFIEGAIARGILTSAVTEVSHEKGADQVSDD